MMSFEKIAQIEPLFTQKESYSRTLNHCDKNESFRALKAQFTSLIYDEHCKTTQSRFDLYHLYLVFRENCCFLKFKVALNAT